MDISSIAGAASMMRSSQTQQALSTAMVKMNAQQQDQMANMLAQNAKQAAQPVKNENSSFSTYA